MNQIRKRLTYANVMSSLAVFLVLGGATAFAATKIGPNQIKANSIKTGKIVKEAVTAGKIKAKAVTESRIADGAVTTNKLADGGVTTNKLADSAVATGKLADSSVATAKIANGAVNATKLGSNSVTGTALADNSVSGAKIAANSVNGPKIAAGAVTAEKLGTVVRVVAQSATTNTPGDLRSASVDCPAGSVAISGSAAWETVSGNASTLAGLIRLSRPTPSGAASGLPTGWEATGEQTAAFERVLRVYAICLAS